MAKLKNALWAIVFLYILYALYREGPSTMMIGLLVVAIIVFLMQIWMKSNTRKRLHEKEKD